MAHKVSAIRVDFKPNEVRVSALSRTNRGTQVITNSRVISGSLRDRAAVEVSLRQAIADMYAGVLPII